MARTATKKTAPARATAAKKKAAPAKATAKKAAAPVARKTAPKKAAAPAKAAARKAPAKAVAPKKAAPKAAARKAPKAAPPARKTAKKAAAPKAAPKKAVAPAARKAAKIAAPKKAATRTTTARKAAAPKTAARKAPIRKVAPRKPAQQARLATKAGVQRFTVSHLNEADFKRDGLRAYALYRELGIAAATGGLCQAHVIRFVPPCTDEVRGRHVHQAELQLVYVLKGWMKNEFEGHGEQMMSTGSCWLQPSGIKHTVLDYSADCEVLEIIVPADFKTTDAA